MKTKNNPYWVERTEKEIKKTRGRTLRQTNILLADLYKEQSEKLYSELLQVLSKIEHDSADGKLYINDLYRTNRIYDLIAYFNKTARKLGTKQIDLTEKALVEVYDKAQDIIGDLAPSSVLKSSFVVPSAVPTKQVINQAWCADGLDFKSRVWKNKEALVKDLQSSLGDFIVRGKSSYEVARGVADRLKVDESYAYRLVRTETAHAQIKAKTDKYKALGFTYGRFHATDPCDECGELDGQRFTLDELETMIPRHPNCECSFLLEV